MTQKMNRTIARALVRLYPRGWRDRYGEEFAAFLEEHRGGPAAAANVVWSAVCECARAGLAMLVTRTSGGHMPEQVYTFSAVWKKPTAYIPVAMSAGALLTVLTAVSRAMLLHNMGSLHAPDEGAAAHIWQLLMVLQLPVILVFATRWLRRAPGQGLAVLGVQAAGWLAACAPVYLLHL